MYININIVTKDVDATYTIPLSTFTSPLSSVENQSVNHKPNEELLTVIEVDENFIQLKQGVSSLERELTYWSHEIETEAGKIDSITGDLYDSNGLLNFIPRTTGGAFGGIVSAATSVINSNKTRKSFIAKKILERQSDTIGFYKLAMKKDSDNFRSSSILDIIDLVLNAGKKVIIFEPNIDDKFFNGIEVDNNFDSFKQRADLIVTNRQENQLLDIQDKVFTRDIFKEN